jgi:hypothetical protein
LQLIQLIRRRHLCVVPEAVKGLFEEVLSRDRISKTLDAAGVFPRSPQHLWHVHAAVKILQTSFFRHRAGTPQEVTVCYQNGNPFTMTTL